MSVVIFICDFYIFAHMLVHSKTSLNMILSFNAISFLNKNYFFIFERIIFSWRFYKFVTFYKHIGEYGQVT